MHFWTCSLPLGCLGTPAGGAASGAAAGAASPPSAMLASQLTQLLQHGCHGLHSGPPATRNNGRHEPLHRPCCFSTMRRHVPELCQCKSRATLQAFGGIVLRTALHQRPKFRAGEAARSTESSVSRIDLKKSEGAVQGIVLP